MKRLKKIYFLLKKRNKKSAKKITEKTIEISALYIGAILRNDSLKNVNKQNSVKKINDKIKLNIL